MSSAKIQYTFSGKVHPERANVCIPQNRFRLRAPDGEIDGELTYYIAFSQFVARFVCEKPLPNIFTLKNYVEDAIRVELDVLGYTRGCGYDLEVISVSDSQGNTPVVFGVGIQMLQDAVATAGVQPEDLMKLVTDSTGRYLRNCLADLREAVRVPKDTGFFCYRAIESLRQFFVHEKGAIDKKKSWQMFSESLSADEVDIATIRRFAESIRHGDSVGITDSQRTEVFGLTWGIVNKFIEYAKAGYGIR